MSFIKGRRLREENLELRTGPSGHAAQLAVAPAREDVGHLRDSQDSFLSVAFYLYLVVLALGQKILDQPHVELRLVLGPYLH